MPSNATPPGERRIPQRHTRPWSALTYRDFRLIFTGQLFSNLGTWMQFTSLTYLIGVVLASSPAQSSLNLAFLGAAQSLPALLCSPVAGFVADRYPRRRTLFVVALGRGSTALALALVAQQRAPWVIVAALLLAALFAGIHSFDFPTRQSWVPLIVPPTVLSNAVGLIGVANNMPFMIGPAIAGILIGTAGVQTSFYIQAAAQLCVVLMVSSMRPVASSTTSREPMLAQISSGVRFVAAHPVLRWVVLLVVVVSLFARPFNMLLAGFAGHVLHVSARDYGTMLAVVGVGTFSGALMTAMWQAERRTALFIATGAITGGALIALGLSRNFPVVLLVLAVLGFGQMVFSNTSVYLVQVMTEPSVRGRALSLVSMIVLGIIPAGTLLLGTIASFAGLPFAYVLGGAVGAACAVWIWFTKPTVRRA